ncbi:mannosyl-oligosaccharide alpha-1,2-mannosidase [Cladophialophora psammophila CBS 110553]|uniref:alpha-1,2-Mannosidase n=1 Tax=Cladophialophora psammophila CBS 110553 TaxID=1182543 RepID=W9WPD6_9EURO|nr:mannosyl-oligosaccharide alpha-1,2-mannosidase [Cladophialophora psammophila CBS 110553]EXJ70047.1 mannosyl-oligosaccharide alpha-1,2-mannosidase [Cladophialophora psammophila CBS 110553]
MILLPPRRVLIVVALAGTALLLLYQLHDRATALLPQSSPTSASPQQTTSPNEKPSVSAPTSFWKTRQTHYPLQRLNPVPTGKPKLLPLVQHQFTPESVQDAEVRLSRQQQVKEAFKRCWTSYHEKAWMRDELSPISGGGRDTFGGWAASLVDALDTLWIMELKDDFNEAAVAAVDIDFSTSTDETINIFETTIRYLGGFLAAYDLSGETQLLTKAVEVGEMLLVAFDTPNHMPITRWDWKKAAAGVEKQVPPDFMLVSELGSLSVEFTRLSQLTGDQRWYDAIDRITTVFDQQQAKTKIPGLWPVVVNPQKQDMTFDGGFTLGGMSDSLYEYFAKEYALLGGLVPTYQKLYEQSMAASIEHLLFRPTTPTGADILFGGDARVDDNGIVQEPRGQHLTCFAGGMFALGGRLFSNSEHVEIGRKLTDGCIWAYENMPRGVMPEIVHFLPCPSRAYCAWDPARYDAAVLERAGSTSVNSNIEDIIVQKRLPPGFTDIDDRRYILRPEAIESVFIMYRITGDRTYQEKAWQMFQSIQNITTTEFANAAVSDVTATGIDGLPPKDNRMESFWLAETLKYFYLIFSEPNLISLDEYVFNTEAHPLRRPS